MISIYFFSSSSSFFFFFSAYYYYYSSAARLGMCIIITRRFTLGCFYSSCLLRFLFLKYIPVDSLPLPLPLSLSLYISIMPVIAVQISFLSPGDIS